MAEINNSLAAQVNSGNSAQPLDLTKTLGAIANIDLAKAHAGLFGLQAQQEARKLHANQAIQEMGLTPEGITEFAKRGGDPSAIEGYQKGYATNNAFKQTNGLMTGDVKNLSESSLARANTVKAGVETGEKRLDVGGKIAQMILTDPSDEGVNRAHEAAKAAGVDTNPLVFNQFLKMSPEQRVQAAKAKVAGGISPADYTAPHNVPPTDQIQTRGGVLNAPQQPVAAPGQQPNPNAQVSSRFGGVPPAMTPGQVKESETYGGEIAKVLPALAEKADNSRQANFTLDQMKRESETWNMGKGGTALMTAQQYIKPLANALGSTAFDKPVADFESFQKNTGTLVRQAVKEVSSRAAVQEFSMIQNQLPSANMSRQGFNQITNQFQAVNDYNIAKHQAGQAWRDATGSMDKFDAEWNKNVTPSAFLVARLPPDQLGALKANLERTADGRQTLGSINKQLKWAHDHNLDGLVR